MKTASHSPALTQHGETKARIAPEQADALLDARAYLRIGFRDQIRAKLRETFGQ